MANPDPQLETEVDSFERTRRALSLVAWSLFAASFVMLLTLSGTTYWTPETASIELAAWVWRASGLAAITLSLIPLARRTIGRFSNR